MQPPFLRRRSGHRLFERYSPQKQFPSKSGEGEGEKWDEDFIIAIRRHQSGSFFLCEIARKVDNLFIGGVPQPAGVWGGVGSGAANETSLIQNGDTLTVLSTVPEPSAMLLSGTSLVGLLALRRRRE